MTRAQLDAWDLEHFQLEVLRDVFANVDADQLDRRATAFHRVGTTAATQKAMAFSNRARWIRTYGSAPEQLTADERWVADEFLTWMPPSHLVCVETTADLVARHRRVMASLDATQTGPAAA